jgi:hypothetical protein
MKTPDMRTPDMRTPLGRVLGYGSAKSGTGHFIEQRLTALANIPLTIAAVLIVISLIGHNHAAVVAILGSSPVAIIMLLFILSAAYHAHPERFVSKPPVPPKIPTNSWINPPEEMEAIAQ